jgi:hypothetical protein
MLVNSALSETIWMGWACASARVTDGMWQETTNHYLFQLLKRLSRPSAANSIIAEIRRKINYQNTNIKTIER